MKKLKIYILQNFENVSVVELAGDLFFMDDKNDKHPFATIVTWDNKYDGTPKFGGHAIKKGFEAYLNLGIDFTKKIRILPHPTYGAMYWVGVVNPSDETF